MFYILPNFLIVSLGINKETEVIMLCDNRAFILERCTSYSLCMCLCPQKDAQRLL